MAVWMNLVGFLGKFTPGSLLLYGMGGQGSALASGCFVYLFYMCVCTYNAKGNAIPKREFPGVVWCTMTLVVSPPRRC